jgi:protein SCO1/2
MILKAIRIFAWGGIAVLTPLLSLGYYVLPNVWNDRATITVSDTEQVKIGGPFTLVSQRGEAFSDADLVGRPYIVFFGFTNCPDICPTTLAELTLLLADLGKDAERLEILFITVDPERDTQEVLFQYMKSFDPRIVALTGTSEQTAAAVKAFRAYSRKVPIEGGGYTMDHTAGIYLMNAAGDFVERLDLNEPEEARIRKVRRLLYGRG